MPADWLVSHRPRPEGNGSAFRPSLLTGIRGRPATTRFPTGYGTQARPRPQTGRVSPGPPSIDAKQTRPPTGPSNFASLKRFTVVTVRRLVGCRRADAPPLLEACPVWLCASALVSLTLTQHPLFHMDQSLPDLHPPQPQHTSAPPHVSPDGPTPHL